MKFKLTKNKLIACLIVFMIFTIIGTILSINVCAQTEELYECTEDYCPSVRSCSSIGPDDIFLGIFMFGIPSFIITYLIYSLFEQKSNIKLKKKKK